MGQQPLWAVMVHRRSLQTTLSVEDLLLVEADDEQEAARKAAERLTNDGITSFELVSPIRQVAVVEP